MVFARLAIAWPLDSCIQSKRVLDIIKVEYNSRHEYVIEQFVNMIRAIDKDTMTDVNRPDYMQRTGLTVDRVDEAWRGVNGLEFTGILGEGHSARHFNGLRLFVL